LKIAVVSRTDRFGGGASKVAEDLVGLLSDKGHTVYHYRKEFREGDHVRATSMYGKWHKTAEKTYARLKKIGLQEIVPFEFWHLKKEFKKHRFDLIHFHDLTTAISPLTLGAMSKYLPVVWTMHDCSPVTGGCVNPIDCEKYKTHCFGCPQKNYGPMQGGKYDLAFFFRWVKTRVHKKNLYLISPSQWLKKFAIESSVAKREIHVLSNGVDMRHYDLIDKKKIRQEIGLDADRFTIVITSRFIGYKSKGSMFAISVLKKISHLKPQVIVVGEMGLLTEKLFSNFDYFKAGYVNEYRDINRYYGAADIFLNCSVAENQPLVVMETGASGTPTLGFKAGGMVEMIEQEKTGFLVDLRDVDGLAEAVEKYYKKGVFERWGLNARKKVEREYNHDLFIKNYLAFYRFAIRDFAKNRSLVQKVYARLAENF